MRSRNRTISVFSISAIDLFAAALGAFILIVLVLFPYYNRGGTDKSMQELEDMVKRRREAAASSQTEMAKIRALQAEIRLLSAKYRTAKKNMSKTEAKLLEVQKQTANIKIPKPPPIPKPVPEPVPVPKPPKSVSTGEEFSILGLATDKKKIAIVVDMSTSMEEHTHEVTSAIHEILSKMKPDFKFVILGYRGSLSTFDTFPPGGLMVAATPSTVASAHRFVDGLPRRFGGNTPTQSALLRALNLKPEAIILMSDGEPTDGTGPSIVRNITARNRGRIEINTVAIGDYTKNRKLTMFLQELALRNGGEFVGRAR